MADKDANENMNENTESNAVEDLRGSPVEGVDNVNTADGIDMSNVGPHDSIYSSHRTHVSTALPTDGLKADGTPMTDAERLFANLMKVHNLQAESSLAGVAAAFVGQWVIVRTYNEGVNFGKVLAADSTGVVIGQARRLWSHTPKDTSQSWYEGVANSGLSADSKTSSAVEMKAIVEQYSLTLCTDEARVSIQEAPTNKQS